MSTDKLRTRYAPSPTGYLHVGGARTALYNFLLARQTGGQFILRIEDTDRQRHDESAIGKIVSDLRWLGIAWDEGPDMGGPYGPYCQSERLELYAQHIDRLLEAGKAYYAFDTPEELEAMRRQAAAAKRAFRYPRPRQFPAAADAEAARQAGRPVVVRFCCPSRNVTIHDLAFGEVTMPAGEMEDFVICKADGYPTFYLANVVDDEMMHINLVMRGQEFLGQTWRQVLLREALGFAEPAYAHLPLIMDMQGRKLSKRDGDVEVHAFRAAGYLPEVLANFIALLGWGPGGNREKLTLDEMIELFRIERIGKTNAKFDRAKLLAFNTDALATASSERLLEAFKDYLLLNEVAIPTGDDALLEHLLKANAGLRTFADIPAKCDVLFVPDKAFDYEPDAVQRVLRKNDGQGLAVLAELRARLGECAWTAEALEALLKDYCQTSGLGMGKVAQPVRVAITGRTVSSPIFDTLTILGKDKALARIDRCLATFARA